MIMATRIAHSGKIYVVDDDQAVRDSLSLLLKVEGFDVSTFASGQELLDNLDVISTGCVVMDIRMPGPDGISVQKQLAMLRPGLAVILLTGEGDIPLAVRALKNGAVDFFEKPFDPNVLLSSIHSALAAQHLNADNAESLARLRQLTEREREVLDQLVAGHTSKEIARAFHGSPRTVDVHRARILTKLGARNVAEAVRIATRALSTSS
jgi:two-component system, LuxR family, response regulator FixJ